jgi:gas vesicle protein
MKSFLAGVGLGFGLGVLLAPMSGQELRANVSNRAGELADRASELADTARDKYSRVRDGARHAVSSVRGEGEERTGTAGQ